MLKLLNSKKVIVSLLGLICVIVGTITGHDLSPETQAVILPLLLKVIGGIVVSFNAGQGLADGLSKGATSAGTNAVSTSSTVTTTRDDVASSDTKGQVG